MPKLGTESRRQRDTCDPRLIRLIDLAIVVGPDFSIVEGHRGQAAQHRAFLTGASKLDWPKGNHNKLPSRAFDFSPYPADWREAETPHVRFALIAGIMFACAKQLGVKIRWGRDWNRNFNLADETFLDWGHIELDEP